MKKPRRNVYLIGYRGTGKTSIARILAGRLGWKVLDSDDLLEVRIGKSIRQVFEDEGETAFRNLESILLAELAAGCGQVIATGGGVVLAKSNRDLLKATGIAVWLRAHPETIWSRLQQDVSTQVRRPPLTTLAGVEEVNELLHVREPLYKECADFEVDTTRKTPQEVAEEALGFLLPAFRDM